MDMLSLLKDKAVKPADKRKEITEAIMAKSITIKEIQSLKNALDEKRMTLVFEAMEAVTSKTPETADGDWLLFAQEYITSEANSLRREASRVVGNIAHLFPDSLETAIQKLLRNSNNDGTVIRWGSAYALGRIVRIPQYANSDLFEIVERLSEQESNSGIKNQFLSGLKKARTLRK